MDCNVLPKLRREDETYIHTYIDGKLGKGRVEKEEVS
jgi:hypothetical protein